MAQGTPGQPTDGGQKPCEFVSTCISASTGGRRVKVNPIQAISVRKKLFLYMYLREGRISCL